MEENLDFENGLFNLVDEDGNESAFELLGSVEIDDVTYVALVPAENEDDEYVLPQGHDGRRRAASCWSRLTTMMNSTGRSPRLKRNSNAKSIWTTTRTKLTTEPRDARKIKRFLSKSSYQRFRSGIY